MDVKEFFEKAKAICEHYSDEECPCCPLDEFCDAGVFAMNSEKAESIIDIVKGFDLGVKPERVKMETGLFDKNGTPIKIGDKTRLVLEDGEVREFDVCFKTVQRTTVKTLHGFEPETVDVSITGVFFCWEGNNMLPCVDENGVSDVEKMEVVKRMSGQEVVSRLFN